MGYPAESPTVASPASPSPPPTPLCRLSSPISPLQAPSLSHLTKLQICSEATLTRLKEARRELRLSMTNLNKGKKAFSTKKGHRNRRERAITSKTLGKSKVVLK